MANGKHAKPGTVVRIRADLRYWETDEAPKVGSRAARKFHCHLVCIGVGIVITIAVTYVGGGAFVHFAGAIPVAVANPIQEIVDRIFTF